MKIDYDKNEILSQINCLKIELNGKPDLMAKTINNESSLVIAVDMINGFCESGALSSDRCEKIADPISKFLNAVPSAVKVFARDCHSDNCSEFKFFPPHCNTKQECAVVEKLKKFDSVDLPKNSTNAFFSLIKSIPDLNYYSNIVIVGVCTDICVMQLALTVRAYLNEINSSSNVVVLTDLVETYDSALHSANLSNLFALKFMEQSGIQIFKNII